MHRLPSLSADYPFLACVQFTVLLAFAFDCDAHSKWMPRHVKLSGHLFFQIQLGFWH